MRKRFLALVVAGAIALFVPVSSVVAATPPDLVTVKVSSKQTIRQLLRGKFVQAVTCRRRCKVTLTALVPARAVKPTLTGDAAIKPTVIATGSATLPANRPTNVAIHPNDVGRKALGKLGSVELIGRVGAVSTTDRTDTGSASWDIIIQAR